MSSSPCSCSIVYVWTGRLGVGRDGHTRRRETRSVETITRLFREKGEGVPAIEPARHYVPAEGSSWWFTTDLHTFKAVSETTNGAYTLTEVTARPGFVPPPHIHHREDEAFYVLEGQFEFSY